MSTRTVPPPADRISIVQTLAHLHFPATREGLVEQAERHGAWETVVLALRALPARQFAGPGDVADALAAPVAPSGAGSGPRGLSAAGDDRGEHPAPVNAPAAAV
jgi:hypothetical protein